MSCTVGSMQTTALSFIEISPSRFCIVLSRESHEVFIDDDDVDYNSNYSGEEYEGGEYYEEEGVVEGEADEEEGEKNDGACDQLCAGLDAMNLTTLKGLPAASGTHIRFEEVEE